MDTIFALASAAGKAGVSIVRVSGPESDFVCQKLTQNDLPEYRKATLRKIFSKSGELLDSAILLRFAENASFTGEPSLEIQCHGSTAVVTAILSVLSNLEGVRLADPGEFTRRALENGKLDVVQVDALSDLIEAETEAQRVQAMKVLDGDLGRTVELWRNELIRLSALIQVSIDFSDEELPDDLITSLQTGLEEIHEKISEQLSGYQSAERIRNGFEVAIVGRPNVGKSTLLNTLAGRQAALTSEIAGTTRDVIEVRMDLNGLAVTLLDTAGVRAAENEIEDMGIEYGIARAKASDVRVFLVECLAEEPPLRPKLDDIVRLAKNDTGSDTRGISGKTGYGVDILLQDLETTLKTRTQGASLLIRQRHKEAMSDGLSFLKSALENLEYGTSKLEIVAEDLRSTIFALESLIGLVGVEDVLDDVFSRFCLGK